MALFERNNFEGQILVLDDNVYSDNTIRNCTIVYSGGQFSMVGNRLIDVKWHFAGPAARTVALLSGFFQGGGESRQLVEQLLRTAMPSQPGGSPAASSEALQGGGDGEGIAQSKVGEDK